MTDRSLNWERITDRRSATPLQSFTCTSHQPRTKGGKQLPHPKPWEREVQSHIRELSKRLRSGELLLVGRASNGEIMAAIHLIIDKTSSLLQVFVASIAVCTDVRGRGGVIANEALSLVLDVAREKAIELELSEIVITGKIHTQNGASEALFARGGFEPVSVPTGLYQVWALNLVL